MTAVRFMAVFLSCDVSVPLTRPNVGIVILLTSVWSGTTCEIPLTLGMAELLRDYGDLRQVIRHHLLSL
jgi:hypothetical protein